MSLRRSKRDAPVDEGDVAVSSIPLLPCGPFGDLRLLASPDEARRQLAALRNAPTEATRMIVRYLQSATIVFAITDAPADVFDPSVRIPGGGGVSTDGEHYWLSGAAYYVDRYGISLPREFEKKALALAGVPPTLARRTVATIEDQLFRLM